MNKQAIREAVDYLARHLASGDDYVDGFHGFREALKVDAAQATLMLWEAGAPRDFLSGGGDWGVPHAEVLKRLALIEGPPETRGADLEDADLGSANLRSADLRRADLVNTDLRGADLRGADPGGAGYNDETIPPKGFCLDRSGMTKNE